MRDAFVVRLGLRFASLTFAAFLILGGAPLLTPSIDGLSGAAHAEEGGTDASSDSNASADSGAGSSADSGASASASAGTNSAGDPTASASGTAQGEATGGETVSGDIGATATATGGANPEAHTETTAGTSAGAKVSNVKSVYAEGGTVYKKEGKRKGYAVSYKDGAYSAAYYKGHKVGAFSGIYSGEKFSDRNVRSLFRGKVAVGAWADRYQAGAYASAYAHAEGWNKGHGASATTGADAFAWVNKRGQTVGETSGFASAWAGKPRGKAARHSNFARSSSCQGSKWRPELRKRCKIWQ